MVNIIYRKYGLKINAVWFCEDITDVLSRSKADILFFHGTGKYDTAYSICYMQKTLLSDLVEPAESILSRMNSKVRAQINRALKEDISFEVFRGDDFVKYPAVIASFKKDYDEFTKKKNIKNTYNEPAVEQYIMNGNLLLTKAFQGDKVFAQHTFVTDGSIARGLYSVSRFRTEGMDANAIGRANKYLHWRDILYLQENHFKTLDWGGISNNDDPNGVDEFKRRFGGYGHSHYNVIIGKRLLGKIVVSILKIFKRYG